VPAVVITQPNEADLPSISKLAWPEQSVASRKQIRLRNWFDAGSLIIARLEEKVIAFAVVDTSFFDNAFIRWIYVDESHRRLGIAKGMVSALMERSATAKLFTSTPESNYAMRLLLDGLGWENVGSVRGIEESDPALFYRAPGEAARALRSA
jgi:ribosomal protein S18 acetylase RimI-like enzyme